MKRLLILLMTGLMGLPLLAKTIKLTGDNIMLSQAFGALNKAGFYAQLPAKKSEKRPAKK